MRPRRKILDFPRHAFFAACIAMLSLATAPGFAAEKAPDFNLKKLDGGRLKLGDLIGEGPVLLNFWASWCKPCAAEAPHLIDLYESYGAQGFHVVGISVDNVSSISKVKAKARKLKLTYPVLLDPSSTYARKLQVNVLPTNVLLDREGNIVRTFVGYRPGDENIMASEIAALLVGEPKDSAEGGDLEAGAASHGAH